MHVAGVSYGYCKCFIPMLQKYIGDVACVAMDTNICWKCIFPMFQLFQMYVATVLFGCCKVDLDVPCVTMASHVCCKFMFQIFHLFSNVCCNWFPLYVAKLVLEVAKVHLLFKFPHAQPK